MKNLLLIAAVMLIACTMAMTSCNVTRTTTTSSQYYQRGDTTVTIQTKTVESYDASKKRYY